MTSQKSFDELEKRADQGDPNALYRLGEMYWMGESEGEIRLPKDQDKALDLIRKSAAFGHESAISFLAYYGYLDTSNSNPSDVEPVALAERIKRTFFAGAFFLGMILTLGVYLWLIWFALVLVFDAETWAYLGAAISETWGAFKEWGGDQPIFVQVALGISLVVFGLPLLILSVLWAYYLIVVSMDRWSEFLNSLRDRAEGKSDFDH